jgi:lactoylglutathione lyase
VSQDRESVRPGLRVELFVSDLDRSVAFYRDVLGFELLRQAEGGYNSLARDGAVIGMNAGHRLPAEHPAYIAPGERPGRGVEIVLMVADVEAVYAQALAAAPPELEPLTPRPWGLTDFRLVDPDGYYLRVTSLSAPG